jgi:hypothetical protein
MTKRSRSACPFCKKTGVCIFCEGKGTFSIGIGLIKRKGTNEEQKVLFTELDCRLCLKSGKCPLCDGKGYIRGSLSKVEKEDHKKSYEEILIIKQRIHELNELDAVKRELLNQKSLNNKDN